MKADEAAAEKAGSEKARLEEAAGRGERLTDKGDSEEVASGNW